MAPTLHVDDGGARCSDEERVVDHVLVVLVGRVPVHGGAWSSDEERVVDHVLVALVGRVPVQHAHRRVLPITTQPHYVHLSTDTTERMSRITNDA